MQGNLILCYQNIIDPINVKYPYVFFCIIHTIHDALFIALLRQDDLQIHPISHIKSQAEIDGPDLQLNVNHLHV